MNGRQPVDPSELGPDAAELAGTARELEAFADETRLVPASDLVDRIMAAVADEPVPTPPVTFLHAIGALALADAWRAWRLNVRVALGAGHASGQLRLQALAVVVVAALLVGLGGTTVAVGAAQLLQSVVAPSGLDATPRPSGLDVSPSPQPSTLPPDVSPSPDASVRPDGSAEPEESDDPGESVEPDGSGESGEADDASRSSRTATPRPSRTPRPSETPEPDDREDETSTPKPGGTPRPSETPQPTSTSVGAAQVGRARTTTDQLRATLS